MTDVMSSGGRIKDPARNGLKASIDAFENGCGELGGRLAPAVRPKIAKAFSDTFETLAPHWESSSAAVLAAARFGGHCAAAHAIFKGTGASVEWPSAVFGLLQAQAECQAVIASRDDVMVMRQWCQGVTLDPNA